MMVVDEDGGGRQRWTVVMGGQGRVLVVMDEGEGGWRRGGVGLWLW